MNGFKRPHCQPAQNSAVQIIDSDSAKPLPAVYSTAPSWPGSPGYLYIPLKPRTPTLLHPRHSTHDPSTENIHILLHIFMECVSTVPQQLLTVKSGMKYRSSVPAGIVVLEKAVEFYSQGVQCYGVTFIILVLLGNLSLQFIDERFLQHVQPFLFNFAYLAT